MKKDSRILSNYVLIEVPLEKHESIKMKSGTEIYVDNTYEPEKHAMNYGTVLKTPDKLKYSGIKGDEDSLDFDTDMELEVGDVVHFHYLEASKSAKRGRVIQYEGKRAVMVRYDRLFFARRGDGIVMTNGWILVDPIYEDEIKSDIIAIPDFSKGKPKTQEGIVRHIGSGIKENIFAQDFGADTNEVSVGDRIAFTKHSNILLEYDVHETMDKKYFRVQQKDIIGIYEDIQQE